MDQVRNPNASDHSTLLISENRKIEYILLCEEVGNPLRCISHIRSVVY